MSLSSTFLTNETMTIVVVKLSSIADMKNVIMPTTHIKFLFFLEVITSVTTLNPSNTKYRMQWVLDDWLADVFEIEVNRVE